MYHWKKTTSRLGATSAAALVFAGIALAPLPAGAQDAANFYRGKTIRILVGGSAGGAYDTATRLIALHMVRHIPGNPAIVAENVPGAASLKMANYLFSSAPRDGTAMGMPNSNILLESRLNLLSRKGGVVQFDVSRFIWVGTAIQEPQILWVMRDSGPKTIDDMKKNKTIMGSTDFGADNYTLSVITNRIVGTKLAPVTGYSGPNDVILAAERGEVQGSIGALSNLTIGKPDWWKAGTAHALIQYGAERHPQMKDIPTAIELAPSERDAAMLRFLAFKFKMARVLFLPPGTPDARVAVLRRAFNETMRDPLFLEKAQVLGLDISPIDGEATSKLVQQIAEAPAPVVDALRDLIEGAGAH